MDKITPAQLDFSRSLRVDQRLTAELRERYPAMRPSGTWYGVVVAHCAGLPRCEQHDSFRLDKTCTCDPRGRWLLAYEAKGVLVDGNAAGVVPYLKPFYVMQGPDSSFMEPSIDFIMLKFPRMDVTNQAYDGQLDDTLLEEYDRFEQKRDHGFWHDTGEQLGRIKQAYEKDRRQMVAPTKFYRAQNTHNVFVRG